MNLCVIPARGGSERIARKNIKEFNGKPMIAWSIEAALASECFDQIIVSTDDDAIAEIAEGQGAAVPFRRPAELSDNYVGTTAVVSHAVNWYTEHCWEPQAVCCLYPTAPFVRPKDIKDGLKILRSKKVEFAFSVTSFAFPIQRAIRVTDDQRVEMFQPAFSNTRSQDLEEAWHDAGQFYWGRARAWSQNKPIFSNESAPVVLPRYRVLDIDTIDDWEQAEVIFDVLKARYE
ncbi:pseudaminic acid cytidylyltransferase [Litorivicinus sp.]|nr:pseudaminic acid cytidylyltransferase [Litorivicinus sp.]